MHGQTAAVADPDVAPVSVVLERISAELSALAAQIDDLQDGLGPLFMHVATDKPHTMVALQGLDAMAQTLCSLSDFILSVGRVSNASHAVEVGRLASRLPLRDLADRLRGHAPGDNAPDDFELF